MSRPENPTALSGLDVAESIHLEDRELFESTKYWLFTLFRIVYDAEALEPMEVPEVSKHFIWLMIDLSVKMTFLHVKKLLDLMRLEAAKLALRPRVPVEIVDLILQQIPESPLVTEIPNIMRCKTDLALEIAKLDLQR
ncbi:uncharacterized protein N7483_001191 [Penicillium malachiteum]|uniref:uncharacterized protein n=1 Tax=Penicillium malachiteum TaxID=1324776 RepID=UPI00254927A0|nr:uncharacterized protein N7483_001191 [Penicillium malachiteum]KAJ5736066.1 hypothetical protein N7483_001191 [Penicillium malachiteum]